MRIQPKGAAEVAAGCRAVTETPLDHPAVEQLQGVLRTEPEGQPGPAESLAAATVAGERPGEHVVAVDARPFRLRPACQHEGVPQANGVVDVEERRFEVGLDAVRDKQSLDHADELVLSTGERGPAIQAVEVTEQPDELRQRNFVDRATLERDRPRRVAPRRLDLRERVERVDVAREDG